MVSSRAHSLHRRPSHQKSSLPRGSAGRRPTAARGEPHPPARIPAGHALHELMVLSNALLDTRDEGEILRLAMDHIAAAGPYSAEAGFLRVDGDLVPGPRG
ncbi:transcriptional regulator, partial [Streptomyces sp. NPDC001773]